jgi:serum/glucocorticoid-regulated kinase 2
LVLTDMAIYNIKKDSIQRRIPFDKLESISISKASSEFVFHLKDDYDYRFMSMNRRTEIIRQILYILIDLKGICKEFKIYEVDNINLNKIMTTHSRMKKKKFTRPSENCAKVTNLQKFNDEDNKESLRKTENRKGTSLLYNKTKESAKDICIDDFEILKLLGKGAFGTVVLSQKKSNEKLFAIKILNKKEIIENNQIAHAKAEKAILGHVNHPFIVGLEYAFQTDSKLYFVLEFMQGGDLYQCLSKAKQFSEKQAKFYTACIALALGHLHKKNYIHRDLKLENILLDEMGYAKLTDFGMAKFINNEQKALTFCGTPHYLSPEVILGRGHNRPTDWWSLGVLIYEMIYGAPPFINTNRGELYKKIVRENFSFRPGVNISEGCKDFIFRLLIKDQTKRLGSQGDMAEIFDHPWLVDIEIHKLLERKAKAPFVPDVSDNKWESNFDDKLIKQKIRESEISPVKVDLNQLKEFQKEFEGLNFSKELNLN